LAGERNARRLLEYKDITWDMLQIKYRELTPIALGDGKEVQISLDEFVDSAVAEADGLRDFGLEARAGGLIDYLSSDFWCFIERDQETGKLVKLTPKVNDAGELIEDREIVD